MHIEELDTPAVVVDLDVLERNLARMTRYCRERHIDLRPHVKTHKIPEIARMQVAGGAVGVTVAKVSEAEAMVGDDINDVLVAYPIVTPVKAEALAKLAHQARITVAVDSVEAVDCLAASAARQGVQLGILVEVDVGFRRCGVSSPQGAVALARHVLDAPHLVFSGLMFYPGHLLLPSDAQTALLPAINAQLEACYAEMEDTAIPTGTVSGGSTPTAYRSHEFSGVTEIRPGMYAFNDRNMLTIGVCGVSDCALAVLVTVVSTAVAGSAIVDGGSKTFSSDALLAGDRSGYGLVKQDADALFRAMSEEHGHLDVRQSSKQYRIGERLSVVPNHVCATVNLHDRLYGHRGGILECAWRVAARGAVR